MENSSNRRTSIMVVFNLELLMGAFICLATK